MTDDYRTIPSLMLKDTDYASFVHGENDVYSIDDAMTMCDALEEVVLVWVEGMQAFDLKSQKEVASEAYGEIALVRLLFYDLRRRTPEIPQKEVEETLARLATVFLPFARSYCRTPMLAQWYLSIPMRVAGTYSRLRRGR